MKKLLTVLLMLVLMAVLSVSALAAEKVVNGKAITAPVLKSDPLKEIEAATTHTIDIPGGGIAARYSLSKLPQEASLSYMLPRKYPNPVTLNYTPMQLVPYA